MMRQIFIFIMYMLMACSVQAQQEVVFHDLSFEEALTRTEAENKLVFIDCHTSWCGPCKYMADSVFPQKEVGEWLNTRFICVQFDMEKEEKRMAGHWLSHFPPDRPGREYPPSFGRTP